MFGGQGLHPRTLVEWMLRSRGGFLVVFAAWWTFSGRGYRAAATDPAASWLSSFPIARATWLCALAPLVFALEAPWLALWAIGTQDERFSIAVLATTLGVAGHFVAAARLAQRGDPARRLEGRVWPAWLALSWAITRAAVRRLPSAGAGLAATWLFGTALGLVMGQRSLEPLAVRIEFIATTLALLTLISAASLRWLLDDDLRRMAWLLDSSPAPKAQTFLAETLAAVVPTLLGLLLASAVLSLRQPSLGFGLCVTALPTMGVAIAATALLPVCARGHRRSRAPLRVVGLLAPYVVFASLFAAPLVHAAVLSMLACGAVWLRVQLPSPNGTEARHS